VRSALDTLPEEQRRTIELAYFGGFSHSQIAELLDEPIGTVKGRMRLGLDKLRRQLAEGYAAGGFA
jgi:RNA polymerase sigma-70 factor (ECF subfamily)